MDDTLLLVGGNLTEACVVRNVLIWFVAVSGLNVNVGKMVVFQINEVEEWDSILRCGSAR